MILAIIRFLPRKSEYNEQKRLFLYRTKTQIHPNTETSGNKEVTRITNCILNSFVRLRCKERLMTVTTAQRL